MNNKLSRREMLKTSTILGAAAIGIDSAWAKSLVAAEKAAATVNFGFSLYGMRALSTNAALKTCADIGYDSVELVCTAGWPCDPSALSKFARGELRKQLDGSNLQLPSLMENLHTVVDSLQHRKNLDRLKAAGELGHQLAPKSPPVIETVLGGRPNLWEQSKSKMVTGLKDWAKVAKAAQTVIAVKAHVGGALHTPHDAKWLVDEVDSPWIRLAYDFSHFQLRNFELEQSLKTMIDKSVFIHVKDTKGKAGDFRFLLPGDGNIDYPKYFRLLKTAGYHGAVVVEVSGQIHGKAGYDPVAAAKRSYTNLAAAFQQSGIR